MPIYEYRCNKCSSKFEVRRGFHDESPAPCPDCCGETSRIFSPVPIIFKGDGFYVTDNRKESFTDTVSEPAGSSASSVTEALGD